MLESLAQIDLQVFRFINQTCANPVTDFIMPLFTNDWILRIGYLIVMILILWKGPKDRRWLVIGSVAALAAGDILASAVIKPWVERARPCHLLTDLHLLVNCGAGYSMPSSHAANAFAQFGFWAARFPGRRWYLFAVAFLVGVSRVFVGVHYPADIIAGGILGWMVGRTISFLERRWYLKRNPG